MLRNLLLTAWILHLLEPSAALAQSAQTERPALHCVVIANQPGRTRDFHYNLRACPANGGACFSKRERYILKPRGDGVTQGTVHCSVQRAPVTFELSFDAGEQDGYQESVEYLKAQTFAWRGLVPNIWCVGGAWFHFTNERSGAGVAPGYIRGTKRGRCAWEASTDPSLASGDKSLPLEAIGSWVPNGKECPGFFDDASRTGDLLWVQPHGIERADGACWLTGLFPLTPTTLPVDALCRTTKGYERTSFTFDRIDGETMRLREGRGRRVTYKRCEKGWFVDPEQKKAADKLKGKTLSFVLDIESQMRSVKGNNTVDGSHTRKIELQVGDDWTLTDRTQIGDSVPPKTFKTRFGEIAIDSAGDRATWLVEDGKLKRVRERKGYYEILSWPLNFDSRSVACRAEMELAPTRVDGKLRTVGTDRAEYDVIKAGIKDERCPTEPLSFAVAAKAEEAKPPSKCINAILNNKQGASAGTYELLLTNACNDNILARMQSEVLTPSIRIIQFGPSLMSGDITVGKNFQKSYTLTFEGPIDTVAILHAIYIDELQVKDYVASCGEDLDETQAVACFSKAYVAKHGEPDWVRKARTAGGCVDSDPDVAIKACTADIASGKTDGDTLNNRAVAYMQKGQFDLALPDLDKAIERDPKHYGALSNRGIVLMKKKDYRRAVDDLTKAIELTPIAPLRPYRQRAEAYAALGEHAKAWKDADEALKIDPKDGKARALQKDSGREIGLGLRPADLAEYCSQKIDAELRVYACQYLIKDGNLSPEDLALAHVYIGQVAEALAKKDMAAKNKEAAEKNVKSALNRYALAIKADMKNPIGYAEIGRTLIALRQYAEAEKWLRKGEEAAPNSRLICERLGLLFERMGDGDRSKAQTPRCLRLPNVIVFRPIRAGSEKVEPRKQ